MDSGDAAGMIPSLARSRYPAGSPAPILEAITARSRQPRADKPRAGGFSPPRPPQRPQPVQPALPPGRVKPADAADQRFADRAQAAEA